MWGGGGGNGLGISCRSSNTWHSKKGVHIKMQCFTLRVHLRSGYYFWDQGIKDFVALDLDVLL